MYIYDPTLPIKENKTFVFLTLFLALAVLLLQGATAEALCIKDKKANLRQGPGKHYEKLWTVFKYMPFKRLGKKGNWLSLYGFDLPS